MRGRTPRDLLRNSNYTVELRSSSTGTRRVPAHPDLATLGHPSLRCLVARYVRHLAARRAGPFFTPPFGRGRGWGESAFPCSFSGAVSCPSSGRSSETPLIESPLPGLDMLDSFLDTGLLVGDVPNTSSNFTGSVGNGYPAAPGSTGTRSHPTPKQPEGLPPSQREG